MLHPVIMAGGSGTRFWPRSRRTSPKQLIQVVGQDTMIRQTVSRLCRRIPAGSLLIVTRADQAEAMREQLPDLNADQIVAEPMGRDTAPAIGLAAKLIEKRDPDGTMLVVSADHIIKPDDAFHDCVEAAARVAAEHEALVTFGIPPTEPSTLYGYLHRGELIHEDGVQAFKLAEFKEKPDEATAGQFLESGDYYWNSGNFVWRVRDILAAIERFMPELHAGLEKIAPDLGTPRQVETMKREYPALPRQSVDYGVMEKVPNAVVVEATFEWDDVGSWNAASRHHPDDADGNTVLAETQAGLDTRNCIIVSEPDHLVATIGVEDLIIVHTPDATLVCNRNRDADVKKLVEILTKSGLDDYL